MTAELIHYDPKIPLPSGKKAWQTPEKDNWYCYLAVTESGAGTALVKRTAHAAAIGRAVLAWYHRDGNTEVKEVRIYQYDSDADTTPAITRDGKELVEVENHQALAVITDSRPVGSDIEQLEKDLEAARILQRTYEAARAKLVGGLRRVYLNSDNLEKSSPDYRSANALAAMVKGVISRPTVLELLTVHEEDAEL